MKADVNGGNNDVEECGRMKSSITATFLCHFSDSDKKKLRYAFESLYFNSWKLLSQEQKFTYHACCRQGPNIHGIHFGR